MKNFIRYRKLYIIIAIMFIGFIIFTFFINRRISITADTFVVALKDAGYDVYCISDPTPEDYNYIRKYLDYPSHLLDFDSELTVITSHMARKYMSNTEISFKVYKNDEEAINSFVKIENSKVLNVTQGDFTSYTKDSTNDIHRVGNYYALYYSKDLEDNYFIVSRINNTLLTAYMESEDIKHLNKLFNSLGYGINS